MVTTTQMTAAQHELYANIQNFAIDEPGASFPLSRRLAKENGWSQRYTQRAIAEYRKFAFLAVVAGHPVSPSEAVDQAWHLHLLYTHSYWERFCGEVLGKPLHHMPTMGGQQEHTKFEDWYAKTLESYERFFGPAPADLWPAPEVKFAQTTNYRWVDRVQHWVIPKPQQWGTVLSSKIQQLGQKNWQTVLGLVGVTCTLLIWALSGEAALAQATLNPLDFRGPTFLGFYLMLLGLCFGGAYMTRYLSRRVSASDVSMPALNTYEMAYLAGGYSRAIETAIAKLAMEDAVSVDSKGKVTLENPREQYSEPLEQAIATYLEEDSRYLRHIVLHPKDIREAAAALGDRLTQHNLLLSPAKLRQTQRRSAAIMAFPLLLGLSKIYVGLVRFKPVGFLVLLCAVTAVVAWVMWKRSGRPRTWKGDRLLATLAKQQKDNTVEASTSDPNTIAQAFALFHTKALADTAYASLVSALTTVSAVTRSSSSGFGGCGAVFSHSSSCGASCGSSDSGGSSCGSSCSSSCGSSCGGGCGGCGG